MKYKDAPAFPCMLIDDGFTSDGSGQITGFKKSKSTGLTKREYFAGLAFQGLMASGSHDFRPDHTGRVADLSIKYADELLKQLEK